jgi:hypothetical protein
MLAGMAALAVPVLIHLLLKRKKKKVAFSTIRFFQQHDEQSSRRRKLRNWLLLALRLLIVSLLVLAFARPYSRQHQASAANRKQHRVVFVLDHSASMLATGTEGQRWSLAKQQMQKSLSDLDENDLVALIECATHANVLTGCSRLCGSCRVLRPNPSHRFIWSPIFRRTLAVASRHARFHKELRLDCFLSAIFRLPTWASSDSTPTPMTAPGLM